MIELISSKQWKTAINMADSLPTPGLQPSMHQCSEISSVTSDLDFEPNKMDTARLHANQRSTLRPAESDDESYQVLFPLAAAPWTEQLNTVSLQSISPPFAGQELY